MGKGPWGTWWQVRKETEKFRLGERNQICGFLANGRRQPAGHSYQPADAGRSLDQRSTLPHVFLRQSMLLTMIDAVKQLRRLETFMTAISGDGLHLVA